VREHVKEIDDEDEGGYHVVILGDSVALLLQNHLRVDGHKHYGCKHEDATEGHVEYFTLLELRENDCKGQPCRGHSCSYTTLDANVCSCGQPIESHADEGARCDQEHHEDALWRVRPACH